MDNITEDEAELYDRQIRLWGLDAQRRLRASSVLLIGLKGLGAEVAKNIILSGIKSITLLDPNQVEDEDRMSQFFVSSAPPGVNRAEASAGPAQLLNPMVSVTADSDDPLQKEDKFFLQFDVICATNCPISFQIRLDKLCSSNKIKFFSGDVFGFYGYSFADLGEHEYLHVEEKKRKVHDGDKTKDVTETIQTKEMLSFSRLEDEWSFDWTEDSQDMKKKIRQTPSSFFILKALEEFLETNKRRPSTSNLESDTNELKNLRLQVLNKVAAPTKIPEDFSNFAFGELSPVCAIVGGVLGQEIIKAVSHKDAPLNNFFFYNGTNDEGMVDRITPVSSRKK